MDRLKALKLAAEAVNRSHLYGKPEANFERIAALWSAFLGRQITATDVAAMMTLLKVARLAETPKHLDSWVDIAGYAACGAEVGVKDAV